MIDAILESLELIKSLVSEILGRWLVLLNTLKIANDLLSTGFLLINYTLEIVKLLVNFLGYFVLEFLLVANPFLHLLTLLEIISTLLLDVL